MAPFPSMSTIDPSPNLIVPVTPVPSSAKRRRDPVMWFVAPVSSTHRQGATASFSSSLLRWRRTLRSWIWIGACGDEVDDAGVEREHERGSGGYKGAGVLSWRRGPAAQTPVPLRRAAMARAGNGPAAFPGGAGSGPGARSARTCGHPGGAGSGPDAISSVSTARYIRASSSSWASATWATAFFLPRQSLFQWPPFPQLWQRVPGGGFQPVALPAVVFLPSRPFRGVDPLPCP
jgi:hypothetical protein